jgi:hypothetical protein
MPHLTKTTRRANNKNQRGGMKGIDVLRKYGISLEDFQRKASEKAKPPALVDFEQFYTYLPGISKRLGIFMPPDDDEIFEFIFPYIVTLDEKNTKEFDVTKFVEKFRDDAKAKFLPIYGSPRSNVSELRYLSDRVATDPYRAVFNIIAYINDLKKEKEQYEKELKDPLPTKTPLPLPSLPNSLPSYLPKKFDVYRLRKERIDSLRLELLETREKTWETISTGYFEGRIKLSYDNLERTKKDYLRALENYENAVDRFNRDNEILKQLIAEDAKRGENAVPIARNTTTGPGLPLTGQATPAPRTHDSFQQGFLSSIFKVFSTEKPALNPLNGLNERKLGQTGTDAMSPAANDMPNPYSSFPNKRPVSFQVPNFQHLPMTYVPKINIKSKPTITLPLPTDVSQIQNPPDSSAVYTRPKPPINFFVDTDPISVRNLNSLFGKFESRSKIIKGPAPIIPTTTIASNRRPYNLFNDVNSSDVTTGSAIPLTGNLLHSRVPHNGKNLSSGVTNLARNNASRGSVPLSANLLADPSYDRINPPILP